MEEYFQRIPLTELYETPLNNRRVFNEAALADLTASVTEKGVLTPILVREKPHKGKSYEILAGARRFRAAMRAGLERMPAMVRDYDDTAALEVVVIENLQRDDVNALEEAEGYAELLKRPGYDVAALAAKVGKSESFIHQRLKLLELIEPAKQSLLKDEITPGHALLLARLQPKDQKEAFTEGCFSERWNGNRHERITVGAKGLAAWIEGNIHLDLKSAPYKTDDATLVPKAGACTTCPKRTGYSPQLFPEIAKKDTCTDRHCYHAKVQAGIVRTEAELKAAGTPAVRLSTDHSYDEPKKGQPLAENHWREIKKGTKHCPSTETGIVVAGRHHHHHQLGQTMQVCTNVRCSVHRPSYGGGGGSFKPSPAEQARRQKVQDEIRQRAQVRRQSFLAVKAAAPTTLGKAEWLRLAVSFIDEMQNDARMKLCEVLGIECVKEKHSYGGTTRNYAKALRKHAEALDAAELARFLVVLPLTHDYAGDTYWEGSKGLMKDAAQQYRVDLKAIEKAVANEFKAKAKDRAERKKKADTRAKKKAKAAAAPKKATAGKRAKAVAPRKTKASKAKPPKDATPAAGAPDAPADDLTALVEQGRGRREFKAALANASADVLQRAIVTVEDTGGDGSAAKLRLLRSRLKAIQKQAGPPPLVDDDQVNADFEGDVVDADFICCESCGCTEDRACPGGCSWHPEFLKQDRWVCSKPACVAKASEVTRTAAEAHA